MFVVKQWSLRRRIFSRARRNSVLSCSTTSASTNRTYGVTARRAPTLRPTDGWPPGITLTLSRSRIARATSAVPSVEAASATNTLVCGKSGQSCLLKEVNSIGRYLLSFFAGMTIVSSAFMFTDGNSFVADCHIGRSLVDPGARVVVVDPIMLLMQRQMRVSAEDAINPSGFSIGQCTSSYLGG